MTKFETARCVLFLTIVATLALTPALAQSDAAANRDAQSEDSPDFVYTTEYLQKRLAEAEERTTVYTNEDLVDDAEEQPAPPTTAFTNDDLRERFGNEGEDVIGAATEGDTTVARALPAAADEGAAPAEPAAAPAEPAEPAMSREEREARISEIDQELARLEKRMLAIRNPLLAGTAPATDAEKAQQAGLDNRERLSQTEAKIEELKKALEELRRQGS